MSGNVKYKVHDFAKDIGGKSNEILDILNKLEEKERTHMAVLTPYETDYLLNHYTKQASVASFDEFLDSGKAAAEEKAKAEAAKKQEPKKVESGPRKIESGPRKIESAPKKIENGPRKIESAPKKVEAAPAKKADQKPAKKKVEPKLEKSGK